MSPKPSSSSKRMSLRNILISVGILAILGIGGFAAANLGHANKSAPESKGGANVAPPLSAEALADSQAKPAENAPNVKANYKPDTTAVTPPPAIKETEKKKINGPADNQLAKVKTNKAPAVAKTDTDPLDAVAFGSPNAPLTIVEYASLACPHCAEFDQNYLPKLEKLYIDKGLVRIVFRPIALQEFQGVDWRAAMLVLCVPPDHRKGMINTLYKQQNLWVPYGAQADEITKRVIKSLEDYGRSAGLSKETVDQCIADKRSPIFQRNSKWLDAILAESVTQDVKGTPTFFIKGKPYSNMTIANWQKTLNPLLPKTD